MHLCFISKALVAHATLSTVLLVGLNAAYAQAPTAAAANAPPSVSANTTANPLSYQSALEGYTPYSDDKIVDWKQANEATARIGGWRAYAKEAAQTPTPQTAAQPIAPAVRSNAEGKKP